jgi:hypothetical protein
MIRPHRRPHRLLSVKIAEEIVIRDCKESGWKHESLGLVAVQQLQKMIADFNRRYYELWKQAATAEAAVSP